MTRHYLRLSGYALLAATCLSSHAVVSFTTSSVPALGRRTNSMGGIGMVQLNGASDSELQQKQEQEEESTNEDLWWKNYKMEHAKVAEQSRPDFEILSTTLEQVDNKPLVYLDSAATSQKPKQVIEALDHYYTKLNSNVHRGAHTLSREATAAYEGARDKVQKLIHANSRNEIIFTSGATESINLVVYSYARANLKAGDEILLTEMEHHSNIVPWQMLAETIPGLKLKFVKMDRETGAVDLKEFKSMLNSNTKMVAFQHVSNVAGCVNPVTEMVQMVRAQADAKILLDACQSVPHMPVDVQTLGVDFLAASGHKMCGPTGIGFLWGREDLLNSMPPFQGGGEMIDQVTLEGSTYVPAPGRFEAGTPAIAQAIGLGAAIDYLQQLGMEEIEAYEHEMAEYLVRRMEQVDRVTVLGPKSGTPRAALCAFIVDGVHPSDLSSFLDMEGVAVRAGHHCCQPLHQSLGYSHSARASLYLYNTKEDVDTFIEKLESTIAFLTGLEGEGGQADDDFVPFI
ncbi:Cysteine desulfurase [Seminavis robusta]|uniref:cysteine desulfurase n=1 Tax=Seminavis robusta TaxID=568900 RepID=A0A9N8H885_9STRA|nr:Cysteine desulfurase [Seminavis robusta]|eukprot:Sro162_g072710.1 Cysteine desulfurase (513) ;mRNA; r:9754-11394